MNHQPFEDWLLAEEPLSADEQRRLDEHLAACPGCTRLAEAWGSTRAVLAAAPLAAPAPGFSQRWEARLVKERAARLRRRTLGISGLLVMALALLAWGGISMQGLSLTDAFTGLLYNLTYLVARALQTQALFTRLLGSVSPSLPVLVWVLAATTFSILSLLWAFTLWRIIVPKGVKA